MRAADLLAAIEEFIRAARHPALVEAGVGIINLDARNFEAWPQGEGVRLHVWNDTANLTRRVVGIRERRPGRLSLEIERFGKTRGAWLLIDQSRASNHATAKRSERQLFAEHFRAFLSRQFPAWEIAQLSAAGDLEHSLSPAFPRALVTQGAKAWAAIAAPPGPGADGALTFGLVWMDYLRQRLTKHTLAGLVVFLPAGTETVTCLRARYLNPNAVRTALFTYDADFSEQPIDAIRHGNLTTALEMAATGHSYLDTPEGRLEARIRADVAALDGRLLREPVYGQVPAFAGRDRGILDLLAVDAAGRLAVIELKASEDIHLPLQALDYWMRVAWHAERGDFARHRYFPERTLLTDPPRLLLVSPALHFHPATEAILRFFSPAIEVDRIGLSSTARGVQSRTGPVHVAFRLHGWREPWHLKHDVQTNRRDSQIHPTTRPLRGG